MNPFYLKFADEAQAIAAMPQYRMDDQWQTASMNHALDVVGVIEGIDAFHINLMLEALPAELESFVVTPATPSRVFAGVN